MNKKASRFKGGSLVTFYLVKDRPQLAKVKLDGLLLCTELEINVSKTATTMKVANAKASMGAYQSLMGAILLSEEQLIGTTSF